MSVRGCFARALAALALVSSVSVPYAGATISPEAQKVLDRYFAATGGRDALLAERSNHTISTLTAFGLKGRNESWSVRPDRNASLTTIGPFTIRGGYDGSTAWRVDQNGKFKALDGKDLEEAKTSNWFDNDSWLFPDQGGGDVTLRGAEKDSTGTFKALTVTPPAGKSREFWFDDKTGLLVRIVSRSDQQTVVTRLSDYRDEQGRKRPYHTHVSVVGMPANDVHATVDSMWVNVEIDASVFAPPAEKLADTRYLKTPGRARLPFHYGENDHVWLKASLNGGPPEDFLLDTGASVTVIDSTAAERYGLKLQGRMQAQGAGAAGGASFSQVDSIRVAGPDGDGVTLVAQKVAVLSVSPQLEPFFWKPCAGILGYDFISRFVTEIDFDGETLTLYDPKTFQYQGKGQSVPLTMAGNIPVVKARIDDAFEGEFRLDVGSGSTVDVHSPFARAHDLRSRMTKTFEVTGGGFGGTFTSTIGRMKKMEIGPYSWSEPLVTLSGAEVGGLASEDYAGNIGNKILERFKCTFDYERRAVYLEPSARYGRRDKFTLAGVAVAKHPDGFKVAQVMPGSAAAAAGLREGDQVVTLDGKPIASYTADGLDQMFDEGKPGDKHAIEIQREGKKKKVTLKLKELL
jgi:hypothetical protein